MRDFLGLDYKYYKKNVPEQEINSLGPAIANTKNKKVKELQPAKSHQSKEKTLEHQLMSLKFRLETYLTKEDHEIIEAGYFLKEILRELGIKNKTFADYIGLQESNLSALFSGKRKINNNLALMLGKIFQVEPTIWLHIQSKNELMRLELAKEDKKEYLGYDLKELLKKVI